MSNTSLKAGAASTIITPPLGAFIAGDKLNRRFTGVHDDLHARALVLHNGEASIALLSVDCLGLTYPDILKLRQQAAEKISATLALPPEHIIVGSTHTHNGPDIIGIYGPDRAHSGLDPEYMDFLLDACVATLQQAAQDLKPVQAWYAEASHGQEWVRNICEPDRLDPSLAVLQLVDEKDQCLATLTNFACHPTILDGVHDVVSGDWVGAYCRAMAESMGGEHLFFQGAIGAWIQPVKGDRSFALARAYGEGLMAATVEALAARRPLVGHQIAVNTTSLDIPLENENWKQLAAHGIVNRSFTETVTTEVTVFEVGNISFATHPGETPPQYALETRALMKNDGPRFVLGLSQDAIGYILTPAYYAPDTRLPYAAYLCSMSLGPEAGPMLMATLKSLLESPDRPA